MTELSYFWGIILGAVQGLTEFLPISSSAHLALVQHFAGLDPSSPTMLLFDVLVHAATLLAVLIVFAKPFSRFLMLMLQDLNAPATDNKSRVGLRIVLLTIVASIPTAAIGLGFQDKFEAAFDNQLGIAAGLTITGFLLLATAFTKRPKLGWRTFGITSAIIVGIAQGLAIWPGISRSGTTICVACFLGLRRRWAAQFSFLMAAPAIVGAATIKLRDTLLVPSSAIENLSWGPLIVASLSALVVGVIALMLLLGAVRRGKLHYFAIYCWIVAAMIVLDYTFNATSTTGT